jgi:hypothetical protein
MRVKTITDEMKQEAKKMRMMGSRCRRINKKRSIRRRRGRRNRKGRERRGNIYT